MLKNLLVHIPSERSIRPIVDSAISLAVTHAAHLDAVSIGYETTSIGLATVGVAAVDTVFEIDSERALARANVALAVFETEVRNTGIGYGLRRLTGVPAECAATMSTLARLYDLTIVLQPEPDRNTADKQLPRACSYRLRPHCAGTTAATPQNLASCHRISSHVGCEPALPRKADIVSAADHVVSCQSETFILRFHAKQHVGSCTG